MTRRVLIGQDLSGNYGLKCSLPGFDVLTDDDQDSEKFSFNSQWTDIIQVHQTGLAGLHSSPSVAVIPFTALSYVPFIEAKMYAGGTYYNDYGASFSAEINGHQNTIRAWANLSSLNAWASSNSPTNQIFYVVYKFGYNSP